LESLVQLRRTPVALALGALVARVRAELGVGAPDGPDDVAEGVLDDLLEGLRVRQAELEVEEVAGLHVHVADVLVPRTVVDLALHFLPRVLMEVFHLEHELPSVVSDSVLNRVVDAGDFELGVQRTTPYVDDGNIHFITHYLL
jgi:hypothetical protein